MSDPMKDWLTNGRDDDLILLTDIMSECEDDKQSKEKMACKMFGFPPSLSRFIF